MTIMIAALLFPGLLFDLALAAVVWLLLHGKLPRRADLLAHPAVDLAAGLLGLLAMLLLPWPLHSLREDGWAGALLPVWALTEAAFLLPLLGELTSDAGARVRAASREAQMGSAGRLIVWLALATAAWPAGGALIAQLPGHLALALAAALALAPALGCGPFAAERGIAPLPAASPLASPRAAALIAAVGLLWAQAVGTGALALVVALAATVLLAGLLRLAEGRLPRLPLPLALRFCWGRLLPLVLGGLIYLAVSSGLGKL